MQSHKSQILVTVMIYLSLTYSAVSAMPMTVEVIGTVNSVNLYQNCSMDSSVNIGSVMTGTCESDTDWMDLDSSDFNGRYWLSAISMNVGNYRFYYNWSPGPQGFIDVYSVDLGYRAYTDAAAFEGDVNIAGPTSYDQVDWGLTDMTLFDSCSTSNSFGTDDSLPTWFPEVSYFNWRNNFNVKFLDIYGNGFEIIGEITSITSVPEPTTLCLLGIGGFALLRKYSDKTI